MGVTANFDIMDGDVLEPYILYKRQDDEGNLLFPKYYAYTIGALYQRPREHDSQFDWGIEAAMQTGEASTGLVPPFIFVCPMGPGVSDCDIASTIIEGHFGITIGDEDESHNRFYIGALIIGDGDDQSDIESFFNLYPDTHRRAGAADVFSEFSTVTGALEDTFHNLTNYFIGWDWTGETHSVDVTFHMFETTEDFGDPEDEIGTEIDIIWNMMHGEHFSVEGGVALFGPGDLIKLDLGVDDDITRVWLMGGFRL
jgi:hypothetical protein